MANCGRSWLNQKIIIVNNPQSFTECQEREIGEIEAALNTHPKIEQGVFLATEDISENKRLVAHVVRSLTSNRPQSTTSKRSPLD